MKIFALYATLALQLQLKNKNKRIFVKQKKLHLCKTISAQLRNYFADIKLSDYI